MMGEEKPDETLWRYSLATLKHVISFLRSNVKVTKKKKNPQVIIGEIKKKKFTLIKTDYTKTPYTLIYSFCDASVTTPSGI